MGMYATLTVVSVPAFERFQKDPMGEHPGLFGGDRFELDKAWSDFHAVFSESPGCLQYVINGDFCPYGGLDDEDGDGTYFACVSPEMVREIAPVLFEIPWPKVLQVLEESWQLSVGKKMPVDEQEYLAHWFGELRKAYQAAAASHSALLINIC